MFKYDEKFYDYLEQINIDNKIIMQFIMQSISPKSIVDFGCGEGAWLKEALLYDNKINILGLDGEYINRKRLKIPKKNFEAVDLRKPIVLGREFDLAISTEVAEHLEESFADVLVDNITNAAKQILFSAAIPNQGGVHHVNEQWQSYWIEKFEKRGYYCDFSIRNYFWNKIEISSWRRQNLLFFAKSERKIAPDCQLLDVVHPEEYVRKISELENRTEIYRLETYIKLDQVIEKLLLKNKKIVIYPYGKNGKLCEKILCHKIWNG